MEKFIKRKIEILRERLEKLIELHGTKSPKVIKCSQRLDKLIYSSYMCKGSK